MTMRPVSLPMLGGKSRRVEGGWEMRFVTDVRRAEEMVEMYRSLGFEVVSEPVAPASGPDGCDVCFTSDYRCIYTRRDGTLPADPD